MQSLEHSIMKSHHPSDVDPVVRQAACMLQALLWSGDQGNPDDGLGEVGPSGDKRRPCLGGGSAAHWLDGLGQITSRLGAFPLLQNQGVFRSVVHRL